jgi:hypothetical protein
MTDRDDDDDQGSLPFVTDGKTETARLAGESMIEHCGRLEQMVLDHVRSCGRHGATCYEIELALDLSHQTASARCPALKYRKLIMVSGRRRPTNTGRLADVLVTPEFVDS